MIIGFQNGRERGCCGISLLPAFAVNSRNVDYSVALLWRRYSASSSIDRNTSAIVCFGAELTSSMLAGVYGPRNWRDFVSPSPRRGLKWLPWMSVSQAGARLRLLYLPKTGNWPPIDARSGMKKASPSTRMIPDNQVPRVGELLPDSIILRE